MEELKVSQELLIKMVNYVAGRPAAEVLGIMNDLIKEGVIKFSKPEEDSTKEKED